MKGILYRFFDRTKIFMQREGLDRSELLWLFVLAAAIIVSRKPDVISNPQFYGEGGAWYSQAYNSGWLHTLPKGGGGYFQIFPRLVVGLCLLAPLRYAPLLMNIGGIAVQALPAVFLLSARCRRWGTLDSRCCMAAVYLALPNSWEINVVLTNAQWHLALLACLVAFASPPQTWEGKIFDIGVLFLCGMTGPWCIILCPLAGVYWWIRRHNWTAIVFGILAACAMAETVRLIFWGGLHQRDGAAAGQSLGATPVLFARILSGDVYVGALWGASGFWQAPLFAIGIVMILGTSVLVYSLVKSEWELRLFLLFCFSIFAGSLKSPLISGPHPQWELLAGLWGGRYWFFPMLALLWSLIWCVRRSPARYVRMMAALALMVMVRGVIYDWKYPRRPDTCFAEHVKEFEAALPEAKVTIPVSPLEFKPIVLVKKR